jgi:murein DD-endopeptidase MepM/ murein hydrolase activator NlpD
MPSKMFRAWKVLLALLVLLVAAGGYVVWRQRQPGVAVTLEPPLAALGHPKRTVTLRLKAPSGPLKSLEARVVQNGTSRTVLTEEFPAGAPREAERPLALEAAALGLKEGPAELVVLARDALWRPRPDPAPRLVHRFTVDLTPPIIELKAATGYIKHAGAGIAVYRVTGAARSGIQVGSAFFPGVSGLAPDAAVQVALFAIPYDGPQTPPTIFAEDEAGNQRVVSVSVTFLPTRFPKDTIKLTEPFLQRKIPELSPQTAGTAGAAELLDTFLKVNREGRKANEAKNRAIAQGTSAPKPLWQGVFRQQSNTKVFANFPEERTYVFDGRTVDTQWHLGIDLASRKQSPVEAANAGRVAFTGANGIYGNMVVLDHGLGLFSLYAHLSEIAVKAEQSVGRGEALGRSGETGMAGGDHLHFAMLVHGYYVNPLEWWDDHWLRDRIAKPLVDAGIALPGVTDGDLTPAATTPEPAPRKAPRSAGKRR